MADRKKGLAVLHKEVNDAKNILIVGGGIVGIEVAGEIAFLPNASEKKITLAVRGDKLLKELDPKAATACDEFLKSKNVEILYKTTITDK